MYLRSDERGPPMNNSMALRIGIFGGVALVLFIILFFRLWFLQVLNGEQYLADANNNRTREFRVSAPRGEILDRNGKLLVTNRTSLALQVSAQKLPEDPIRRHEELQQLADLTHTTLPKLQRTMREEEEAAPGAPVTLRRDVGSYLVYYLEENKNRFPGVDVERVFVRSYPHESMAAHIVGTVTEVDAEDLEESRFKGLEPGDEIGKDGVEETYDKYLRGEPGVMRIQVDAFGQPTPGGQLISQRPVPGENLKLTIDSDVQNAGEAALSSTGLRGAFLTMDVHTGEILGMGSFPTFDPAILTRPMTQAQVDALYRDDISAPLTNRAIAGLYPSGSTFKLVTALAALENGITTPDEVIEDSGSLTVGGQTFTNAGEAANGSVSLVPALEVSSDVYFYVMGLRMWDDGYLQQWAHQLGIGRDPGIDLPGAAKGTLPTQQWRNKLAAEGELEGRRWSAGDNVQLATGPGRPADQPAADGDGLRDPRQRRHRRHPAHRQGNRRRAGPRDQGIQAARSAQGQDRPGAPGRDHGRPPRCRPGRRGHIGRRLRRLPDRSRRQDRHRRTASEPGPVLVRGPRPVSEPGDRHRGDDGGRRLRRRNGRAGGEGDPRSVFLRGAQRLGR